MGPIREKIAYGRHKYFETALPPSHDKRWSNFIETAKAEIRRRKEHLRSGEKVEWHVEHSSYVERAKNDRVALTTYTNKIEQIAADEGVELMWFTGKEELAQNLNSGLPGSTRPRKGASRISRATIFSHGLLGDIMVNPNDKTQNITREDLQNGLISGSSFTDDAIVASYACRSSMEDIVDIPSYGMQVKLDESFHEVWEAEVGTEFYGVDGRTSYIDAKYGIARPSQDEDAEWVPGPPPE